MRRLAFVLILLAACATEEPVIRHNSAPNPPAWRDNTPNNPMYLYFVGAKSGAESLNEGKAGALANAISQVAQYIGVDVKAFGEFVQSTTESENKASEQVNLHTTGQIQGAEAVDTYYESITRQLGAVQVSRFDVWVLVRFPRDAANAERARQQKEQEDRASNALDLYNKAQAARAARNRAEALRLLALATDNLSHLTKDIDLHTASFKTSHELAEAVKTATDDVRADNRRSLIVSSEVVLGTPSNEAVAANSLAAGLTSRGFPALQVVTPSDFSSVNAPGNAALIIQVKAKVARGGWLYRLPVCLAHVTADAIDPSTHEVVAEVDEDAKGIKASESIGAHDALVAAGSAAAKDLATALLKRENAQQ